MVYLHQQQENAIINIGGICVLYEGISHIESQGEAL